MNRILWSQDRENYTVVIVDRLSPTGYRELGGLEIRRVLPTGFLETVEGSLIPVHRVVEIKRSGRALFRRPVKGR